MLHTHVLSYMHTRKHMYYTCIHVHVCTVHTLYICVHTCTIHACTVHAYTYRTCIHVDIRSTHTCTCIHVYTVQLTRNLNASVEYERFYSRVSMCETRALEHSYSSFTRRSDLEHSSTRALVLELEHSSARLDSTRTSQLDIRIRAIEHRTRRISMHAQELINSTPVRIWRAHERYRHPLRTRAMYSTTTRG